LPSRHNPTTRGDEVGRRLPPVQTALAGHASQLFAASVHATESAKPHGIRKERPSSLRKVDRPEASAYAPRVAMRSIQQPGGRRPVLDDLDKAIIKALQLDGRRPYAQIGRQLQVPEATVRQRAERLIGRGVVQIVGVTDPLAMGFQQPALIGLKVDPGRLDRVAEEIAALEEVTYVVITAGRYDLFCEVVCEDNEHLLRVLTDRFAAIEGIRSTETLVELRFVKESYQWGAR
jgi:Lrp/AsnC family transcriptional regulator for asnA, asnC and gidA